MHTPDVRAAARTLGGDLSGPDSVLCPGPGHSHEDRSLSIKFDPSAPDGFVVYSFAGDDPIVCRDHLRERLGLEAFKPNGSGKTAPNRFDPKKLDFNDAPPQRQKKTAGNGHAFDTWGAWKEIEHYDYKDQKGTLLYQVIRRERFNATGEKEKDFPQRRPDGNGWTWGLKGAEESPLYRLPELLRLPATDTRVFVCEGEKDANRVVSLGLCATTISGGAQARWDRIDVSALSSAECTILEHNDDAGRTYSLNAAHRLQDVASSIRIVQFPELPAKGDVSDWLDADPARNADALVELCLKAPLWEPQQEARLIKTSAEFADFIPPDYLVDGLMIRGYLYSCTALTGGGKTAIAVLFTAYAALGRNLGDMEISEPCRVLYFAGENAMDVKMRWVAMCGELGIDPADMNVRFVDRVLKFSEATKDIIREVGDDEYGLIIVDTSAAYIEGDDENNNKQLLDHAKRLRALTELPGRPTVFVCTHPIKSGDNLLPRGGGAFLNEVDGNFTLKNTHGNVELHWQGKIRGADFDPKHFRLKTTTHPKLVDSKGRLLMTVLAEPITSEAVVEERRQTRADENVLLVVLKTGPGRSFAAYAEELGWRLKAGVPDKKRVSRAMDNLIRDKLVEKHRGRHRLTPKGQKEVAG
jgi:AAA domain